MAVTGLPDAQADHAVRMVRFSRACMQASLQEINRLEVMLGPGTGTLRMRCGIHSGPGKLSPTIQEQFAVYSANKLTHNSVLLCSNCGGSERREVKVPTVW